MENLNKDLAEMVTKTLEIEAYWNESKITTIHDAERAKRDIRCLLKILRQHLEIILAERARNNVVEQKTAATN